MLIEELDILERVEAYKLIGFPEFLEERPSSEDFGESLDLYRKKLMKAGLLDEHNDTSIRGLHLHHQAKLLNNDNPINTVNSDYSYVPFYVDTFCEELHDIIRNNSISTVLNLYNDYVTYNNMYINSVIFEQLYRLKAYDEIVVLIKPLLRSLYLGSNDYWDNKETCYGAAMLVNRISSLFSASDLDQEEIADILKSTIKLSYILLTRIICWPEESVLAPKKMYDLPISHEHRIAAILKRIDLLEKYHIFFSGLIPGLSTVETLIVSDYYSAHELSFATSTLGRKSEFKRDARNKYKSINDNNIRPYSTCITDGKKDSLELAYRFYLSYKAERFELNNDEVEKIAFAISCRFKTLQSTIPLKFDKDKILEYLKSNGIEYFYHFTEEANLENIRKSRGLFSQRECLSNSIIPKTSGEMRHLRNKDAEFFLEDYVRLSFCKRHPLIEGRSGNLVLLKFKIDVALFESTLFSDRDAALDEHEHGNRYEDLLKVRLDATKRTITDANDPDFAYCQAEIMVRSFISQEYIVNLDKPELL